MAGHYFVCGEDTPNPIVQCFTTKGPLSIEVYRDWAPLGADRFLELVKDNFFTDIAFFRCVNRFLTQFGISDNPEKKHWHRQSIKDDPNKGLGIKKHYVSFAGGGPNTRSSQIFIAFEDLDFLGKEPWETPFGKVIVGQDTLDNLYKEYGDIPPFGEGPDQQEIFREGNAYVREFFPHIDFIQSCSMLEDIDPDADREEDAESLADAGLGGAAVGKGPTDDALVIEGGHELTPEDIANEQSELDGEEVAVTANSNYELRQHKVRKAKLRRGKGVLDGHTLLEDLHDTPQEAQRRQEALIFRAIFILAAGVILLYLVIMRYGRRGSSWSKGS